MIDQFADRELESKCFKLDFKYFFERTIKYQGETHTLLSVIESWIWEKYKIVVSVADISIHHEGYSDYEFETTITDKDGLSIDYIDCFESPITAKNEGIKKTIEYLT